MPQDYQGVKKKFAEVIGKYKIVNERYETLLTCWEREANKRAGD